MTWLVIKCFTKWYLSLFVDGPKIESFDIYFNFMLTVIVYVFRRLNNLEL